MRTQWNDDEDRALDYLPYVDQVIYLRGIRRRMDFDTGYAGMNPEYPISYLWLSQMTEVHPRPCSKMKPPPRLDKNGLRAVFDRLEAAGLVQRVRDHGLKSLVFFCALADRGQSAQKMNNPSTTHEQPTISNPPKPNNGVACDVMNNPSTTHHDEAMSNPIQVSGNREEDTPHSPPVVESPKRKSQSRSTWTIPHGIDPVVWSEFEQHRIELRKPLTDRAREKNAAVLLQMSREQQRISVDQTIANAWAGIFVTKHNGHDHGTRHEKPHHRIQREQFERVAAHDWSDGPPFNDRAPCEVG